jgi:hypothetical protein
MVVAESPGDRLSWQRFSLFSSVPPGKSQDSTLNYVTTSSFHILSNSLFTNHPIMGRYNLIWAIDSVYK